MKDENEDENTVYDEEVWKAVRKSRNDTEEWDDGLHAVDAKGDPIYCCEECGETNQNKFQLDDDRGEVYCKECGNCVEDVVIDMSAPTRRFSADDPSVDNAHYGAPISDLYADRGLPTTFNPMEASPESRRKSFILRRINQQTVTNKERNLAVALRDIERVVSRGALPKSVHAEAVRVYRDAVDKQLIRGRSIEGMVAASLYTACRMVGVPRSLDEIADLTRTGRKEIARNYNTLKKNIMRLKKMRPPSPEQYLDRYIGALNLSLGVRNRASTLMQICFNGGMNQGRNPIGIVAACIYISCVEGNERRTQRQIARELEITEVTIRNRYKEAMAILATLKESEE